LLIDYQYDHTAIFKYKRYDKWILSFEDLSLGDKDYADVLYWITTSSGNFTPLPVELIGYFYDYKNSELKWITASEENNDFFTIKIMKNDGTIVEQYNVIGAGNSNVIKEYSSKIYEDDVYVFISQTDYDGKVTDLSVLYINKQRKKIRLYNNDNYIEIVGEYDNIIIYDLKGSLVNFDILNNRIYNLKKGYYIIKIDNNVFKTIY